MVTKPEDILPLIEAGKAITEQQAFEAVSYHLSKQGKPAFNNWQCMYRYDDGLKCAAGCLIPDSLYGCWMEEGMSLGSLLDNENCPENLIKSMRIAGFILLELQEAHDRYAADPAWFAKIRLQLECVGRDHKLDLGFMKELSFG